MEKVFRTTCGYGEQVQIAKKAMINGCSVKIEENMFHDNFFIVNNEENPSKTNGRIFKFIFMRAEEQDSFHNTMFIVGTNNKNNIENWKI